MTQYQVGLILAECAADWNACEKMFRRLKEYDPAVLRIALVSDPGNKYRAGSFQYIHQFLLNSCSLEQLEKTLESGFGVWEMAKQNSRMVELVAGLKSIPTPPLLYFDIKDELDSPNGSLQGVARLIGRDPALTAKILKIANSGLYVLPRTIADLDTAIGLLGTDMVMALVLGAHLYSQLPVPGLDLDKMWMHSMAVSSLAKQIATDETGVQKLASAAGVAGLLHDVGQLVLLAEDAAAYYKIIRLSEGKEEKLVEFERQQFGVDHAQLGGYLLALWGLPDDIVAAVIGHHGLTLSLPHPLPATVRAVLVAEWLLQEYAVHKELLEACASAESQAMISSSDAIEWWKYVDRLVEQGIVA